MASADQRGAASEAKRARKEKHAAAAPQGGGSPATVASAEHAEHAMKTEASKGGVHMLALAKVGRPSEPVVVRTADASGATVYASPAVELNPNGVQFDFARSSARTPHGAYV